MTNEKIEKKDNEPILEEETPHEEVLDVEKEEDSTDEVVEKLEQIDTIPLKEEGESQPKRINEKPNFLARIMGAIIELCLILMGGIGLVQLIYHTGISSPYYKYVNEMKEVSDVAKLDTGIGKKLYSTDPTYGDYTSYIVHTDEVGQYIVVNNENYTEEMVKNYNAILNNNVSYVNNKLRVEALDYAYTVTAAGISEFLFIFIIPLVNKRRATPGKLAAGTMLIHRKTESRAKWWQVMVRFIWIFVIETALPLLLLNYLFAAIIVSAIVFLLMLISKKENRTLHDLVSGTRVIDTRTFVPITEQE